MKRRRRVIISWFFQDANGGQGAELFQERSYKIKTKEGNFWGRFVRKLSFREIVLRGMDNKERTVTVDEDAQVFNIGRKADENN